MGVYERGTHRNVNPVTAVEDRVEQNEEEETNYGDHDDIEQGRVDGVMHHLVLQGIVDVLSGDLEGERASYKVARQLVLDPNYHNTDDPEEANEQDIKRDKEAEEASHCRHATLVWVAVDKVVRYHVDRGGFIATWKRI